MSPAASSVQAKYSVPRNRLIPDASTLNVLMSGSMFKSREGKVEGYPLPLSRCQDSVGTKFTTLPRGVAYYFHRGRIYLYDEARTAASLLFEGAATAATFALPGVADLAGDASKVVEHAGKHVLEGVIDRTREPGTPAAATYGDQVRMLEHRGMVLLPGVNLVDVECQFEPGGFLSRATHTVTYSYEGLDGERARYRMGAPMNGKQGAIAKLAIELAFDERMRGEAEYLGRIISGEYAPGFDAIVAEMRSAFDQARGDGSANRSPEWVKAVSERYDQETERNGLTPVKYGQRALELLEPMREIYDRTPSLSTMMQSFRTMATGQAT